MKIQDILQYQQQLDEISWKQAVAAGTVAAGSLVPMEIGQDISRPPIHRTSGSVVNQAQDLADIIVRKYRIDPKKALHIVHLAHRYEKPDFPKAIDILAVIGIESSFDSNKQSNLKHDPAMGLTQIRTKMWQMNPKTIKGDLDSQIKMSAHILNKYYYKLNRDPESAVHAYNVGLTAFKRGQFNPQYVEKFNNERRMYM